MFIKKLYRVCTELNPEIRGDVVPDFREIINLIEQSLTGMTLSKPTPIPKSEWEESWLLMYEKNVGKAAKWIFISIPVQSSQDYHMFRSSWHTSLFWEPLKTHFIQQRVTPS